jgi:hypothetical protein
MPPPLFGHNHMRLALAWQLKRSLAWLGGTHSQGGSMRSHALRQGQYCRPLITQQAVRPSGTFPCWNALRQGQYRRPPMSQQDCAASLLPSQAVFSTIEAFERGLLTFVAPVCVGDITVKARIASKGAIAPIQTDVLRMANSLPLGEL